MAEPVRRRRRRVQVADPGKLLVLGSVVAAVTLLAALGRMGSDAALMVYIGVLGYVTGNGRLAFRGKTPQPLLEPADEVEP